VVKVVLSYYMEGEHSQGANNPRVLGADGELEGLVSWLWRLRLRRVFGFDFCPRAARTCGRTARPRRWAFVPLRVPSARQVQPLGAIGVLGPPVDFCVDSARSGAGTTG
jgi:hypothetical protein